MLLPVNDILFATDFSQNADYALRYALSMAKAHNSRLHVLHVAEPLSLDVMVTFNLFISDEEGKKKALESRHAAMKDALKDNQKRFVKGLSAEEKEAYSLVSSAELLDGHAVEGILKRADSLNCHLIVVGSHEQNTSQTFLGSVALGVLRRSSIPVLVVPPSTG
jgi:nucleotide-binding universal stress UspA family protein